MGMNSLQDYCLTKKESYVDHPFGAYPICIKVRGKIFAQLYPDKITLKCTRFQGELFRQNYPGVVVRGYHCPPVQQPYMIDLAYEAVLSKFSRKLRQEIEQTL